MKLLSRDEIERILPSLDLLPAIETPFVGYSEGRAVVPPVGELQLDASDVVELGHVISGKSAGRASPDQITVADLTGVAVQDIGIAAAVFGASDPTRGR